MGVQINGDTGNISATKADYSGNVTIGGTLTYEDVTNIDSVGLVTARNGIEIGARPGVAASISVDGNMIVSGISTFGGAINVSDDVTIVKSSGPLLELTTNTGAADATLRLSEGATGSTSNGGGMFYSGADNKLHITCGTDSTTKRITIARDDGKIGIGTASPATDVHTLSSSDHIITHQSGTSGADVRMNFRDNGSVDQGGIHYAFNGNSMRFRTAQGERVRIDSNGKLLVNHSSAREVAGGNSLIQVEAADATGRISIVQNRTEADGAPFLSLGKSRGGSVGSATIVQSGDTVGTIAFAGADGTDFPSVAQIVGQVDGTPGNNDMPGRLIFKTCPDGSDSTQERLRIASNGRVGIGENSPDALLHLSTGASATCEIRLQSNNTGSGSGDRGRINVYSALNNGTAYQAGYVDIDRSSGTDDIAHLLVALNDGSSVAERLRITGSGIVTKSYQPYFVASAGSNRDNVTDQVLVFSTAVRNNGSHYDTSNSRFTAPVTGAYIFGGTPAYQETGDTMSIQIRKNGTTVFEVERVVANSMNQHSAFGFSTLLYLSASDYVDLYVAGQCHQNGSYSHWFGYLLG